MPLTPVLILLCLNLLINPQITSDPSANTGPASQDASCTQTLKNLEIETNPGAREYQIRLLAGCARNEKITRALEQAINDDDSSVRQIAWRALGKHLDQNSLSFLLKIYNNPPHQGLQPSETIHLLDYLQSLATPVQKETLRPYFFRYCEHPRSVLRRLAVQGLGRIQSHSDIKCIIALLEKENTAIHKETLRSNQLIGLQALRNLKDPRSLEYGLQYLNHHDPGIQRVAIQLVVQHQQVRALAALIKLDYYGAAPQNLVFLQKALQQYLSKTKSIKTVLILKEKTNLKAAANQRARPIAALNKGSVLFMLETTAKHFRLFPETPDFGRPVKHGPFIKVVAVSGLSGWLHSSQLEIWQP